MFVTVCFLDVRVCLFGTRLLANEHVQLLWFTYCSTDRVELDSFLSAVRRYLSDQLKMPADEVESVLSRKCLDALSMAVDVDGDKQVTSQPTSLHMLDTEVCTRVCLCVSWRFCALPLAGDGEGGEPSHGHARCAVP